MKSRRKNLKRNVPEKVGRTARCPGWEQGGNLSEECQKQIEKEMIGMGGVIDTEAVKTNTHTQRFAMKDFRVGCAVFSTKHDRCVHAVCFCSRHRVGLHPRTLMRCKRAAALLPTLPPN